MSDNKWTTASAVAAGVLLGTVGAIAWLSGGASANPPPPPPAQGHPANPEPADEPIVRAVAKTLPAVVNINAERLVAR